MATELWLRNVHDYRSEVRDLSVLDLSWNALYLQKRHISVDRWHELHIPAMQRYRALYVDIESTIELDQDHPMSNPVAVHPTWIHGQSDSRLEAYLREQLPFVTIAGIPPYQPPFLRFYDWISDLQLTYPDTKIHLHGADSFAVIFGLGFKSADYDPIAYVQHGAITLPCGKNLRTREEWALWGKWFRLIGYDWRRIRKPTDMVQFNITAAHWAATYYNELINFRMKKGKHVDLEQYRTEIPVGGNFLNPEKRANAGSMDKVICNACSLAPHCKLYREGAVCTLSDAPTSELARLFTTRDSNKIIEGIGKLVAMNVARLEEGRNFEAAAEDGISDSVTKLMSNVIDQGIKLAKLVNPTLAKPGVQVNLGFLQQVQSMPPHQLAAVAIHELERQGHTRESITSDMVESYIKELVSSREELVEAEVISDDAED